MLKDAITNSHNLRLPVPIQKKSELHHHTSLATVNLNVPWQAMAYEICTTKFSLDLRWFPGIYQLKMSVDR